MNRIWKVLFFLVISLTIFTSGCDEAVDSDPIINDGVEAETESYKTTVAEALSENSDTHEDSQDYVWSESDVVDIQLADNSISINGTGAGSEGNVVTISAGGTYRLSGSLSDGKIIVDSDDELVVRLIFNGVNISCSNNAPVFIKGAEKAVIILNDGSTNYLTDSDSYVFEDAEDDEPNACLFSKDDLSISGNGTLTVNANYNDGITSKDGLIVKSGNISVTSVDDGIRGKDYLVIEDGIFTLNTEGDALKSDEEDIDLGYILIEGGTFNISSGGDAVTAENDALITNGNFNIITGGGSNYYDEDVSAKGIKAGINTIIDDGDFEINSADDAVHSNAFIVVNGGDFNITTGDDGVHSDSTLGINGGEINITESYEGIESSIISITNGNINIVSSDDGLNVAGGNDGSGWGHGGDPFSSNSNNHIYIIDGYIAINATGDGIDANGSVTMTGGTVIVHGPSSNNNGALDFDGSFQITGGFLLAVGSSGMAQAPGSSSGQYSFIAGFSTQQSGNIVHCQTSSGETLFTFSPIRPYQSVVFSSPSLATGVTYELYFGGSSTGTENNGLYSGGTYSSGSKYCSFSLSSVTTVVR